MDILAVFIEIDDFCLKYEPKFNQQLIESGERIHIRASKMSRSEVMTIPVAFHGSGFRNENILFESG